MAQRPSAISLMLCDQVVFEQGTQKPTIHPVKLLALAYGLMPEVAELFSAQVEELVVT